MKNALILITALLFYNYSYSQVNIIPQPASVKMGRGVFKITKDTKIVLAGKGLEKQSDFLNSYLQEFYGFKLKVVRGKSPRNNSLFLQDLAVKNKINGAYKLEVSEKNITVWGDDAPGVFYAIQTIIQLLPTERIMPLSVQQLTITDLPRFAYRGMMLDVSRHFFSVEYVKKVIDFMALHKLNTFHWHLTEDQGWRIEIKKYPLLTQVGACRNGTITGHHPGTGNDNTKYCGYYTQDQIKDVVKYAADRFITVIPEIELPGHSSAAIAAYPQLSCFPNEATKPAKGVTWVGPSTGKQVQQSWGVYTDVFCPSEYTFGFLQDVFDEILQLFPSKFIHIGGDECPKESWKRSAFCQNLIKEKNLKDEHGLQSYFVGRIEKYLNSKGRNIIGWDEILEGGLAPNATVMSWRGEKGGIQAAKQKHNVIMAPNSYVYLNHGQKAKEDSLVNCCVLPLDRVYSYNPIPAELTVEEQQYIIGAQANLWTEYIGTASKAEYQLFPRFSALSEVFWTAPANKNYDDFKKRLVEQFKRYELWKLNYNKTAME